MPEILYFTRWNISRNFAAASGNQGVLSVHHAAEAFCNMLLKQFDHTNRMFKRGQQDWWPSLVTGNR